MPYKASGAISARGDVAGLGVEDRAITSRGNICLVRDELLTLDNLLVRNELLILDDLLVRDELLILDEVLVLDRSVAAKTLTSEAFASRTEIVVA